MPYTFAIIKPDVTSTLKDVTLLEHIESSGFNVHSMYSSFPTETMLRAHYAETIAKRGELIGRYVVDSMSEHFIIPLLIEGGPDVVFRFREYVGSSFDPKKNGVDTLRYRFSNDTLERANLEGRAVRNALHASDSNENAEFEINLWFNKFLDSDVLRHHNPESKGYLVDGASGHVFATPWVDRRAGTLQHKTTTHIYSLKRESNGTPFDFNQFRLSA